jgi:hypothetical protein
MDYKHSTPTPLEPTTLLLDMQALYSNTTGIKTLLLDIKHSTPTPLEPATLLLGIMLSI